MANTNSPKKTSHIIEDDNRVWLVFSEFHPLSYEHAINLLSRYKEHGGTYLPSVSFHKLNTMVQANEKLKQLQYESAKRMKELSSNDISGLRAISSGVLAALGGAFAVMLLFAFLEQIKKGLFG